MGRYDSSRTRVAPVFDALLDRDLTGQSWLTTLMRLGSRSDATEIPADAKLITNHRSSWGKHERRLDPHPELLRWLVKNIEGGRGGLGTSKTTRDNREKLIARDPTTINLALQLLEDTVVQPKWYVLEGPSQPDAYLEATEFILVIEGKRTERGQTTTTSWMSNRNQMLRHMDAAAWNAPPGKRIYGLMIVEGKEGGDDPWNEECAAIVSDAVMSRGLPHLNADERRALTSGFLGFTTWQRVCRTFELPWPPVEDSA